MNIASQIDLWNVDLTWYSPCATLLICFYIWEHDHGIHDFRHMWLFLTVEVLETWMKFFDQWQYYDPFNFYPYIFCFIDSAALWPSSYWQTISSWIILRITVVFGGGCFQITHRVNQRLMCSLTTLSCYSQPRRVTPYLELLRSRDICAVIEENTAKLFSRSFICPFSIF